MKFTIAILVLLEGAHAVHGQYFDEPSVMNLPYTQAVPDPLFAAFSGLRQKPGFKRFVPGRFWAFAEVAFWLPPFPRNSNFPSHSGPSFN